LLFLLKENSNFDTMQKAKQKKKAKPAANTASKTVIVTKSKAKAKDSLFAGKVAAMNALLSKAKLLPS
jgi:hypothetical protein